MSDSYSHSIPLAVKFSNVSEVGNFVGYGATFGDPPDAYGDIIKTGAFAQSLSEHRYAGTTPALLWSHDVSQPIGVIKSLSEDDHGLRMEGRLTLEVARAAEALALMKAGALAFSIGYQTKKATALGKGVRRIDEIKLYEISAVAMPANHNARLVSVKMPPDLLDQNNPRAIEKILRDAGVARNRAKRIVALGRSAFRERDVLIADSQYSSKLIAASRAIGSSTF